jgi:aryl-alcohol dehydrogenase-like predicted oxidoreductase
LQLVDRREFYRRLGAAFAALEKAVADGKIPAYGVATWTAFRVASDSPDAVSLEEVLRLAEKAGGSRHHFRAVQAPLNLAMTEALAARTQTLAGTSATLLEAARRHGLMVFASASLLQGSLTEGLPEEFAALFPGLKTDAQRALQFVRSAPGVTCALVGMSRPEHAEENLGAAVAPPLSADQFRALFARS